MPEQPPVSLQSSSNPAPSSSGPPPAKRKRNEETSDAPRSLGSTGTLVEPNSANSSMNSNPGSFGPPNSTGMPVGAMAQMNPAFANVMGGASFLLPFRNPPMQNTATTTTTTSSTNDAMCAICKDKFVKPSTMKCGHQFCRKCIVSEIDMKVTRKERPCCPTCEMEVEDPSAPDNYLTSNPDASVATRALTNSTHAQSEEVNDLLKAFNPAALSTTDLSILIDKLTQQRNSKLKDEEATRSALTNKLLQEYVTLKHREIDIIHKQIAVAKEDMDWMAAGNSYSVPVMNPFPDMPGVPMFPQPMTDTVGVYWNRARMHIAPIYDTYSQLINTANPDDPGCRISNTFKVSSEDRLACLGDVVRGVTKYGMISPIATLNYHVESMNQLAIVSSLEFDKDGEFFVVAGVSKKIKMFNYENVVENPTGTHYPRTELKCKSKISNVSWNAHLKSLLASSDYDGHVTVWDTEEGREIRSFQEHEKRCWTVNFNNVDPNIIASGSDDSKVKLWSLNIPRSVNQIDAKVNVCCVCFSPSDRNQLVFGSADHSVHLYDIRNTTKALKIFRGHRKAVSYVRYLNEDQVVSASTDSSLRIWNSGTGMCQRILRGHTNEKNFVGLSSSGDHIVCGSENSNVYFYYKEVCDPVARYRVGKEGPEEENNDGFVSSVCWRKNTDIVLVANSHGRVQILQLS